ncbi:hypothetical protein HK097_010370 [Rhizophlyctis rosea]|uniref:Uncharacterized protein n=1 Tax=Rhizophlyctis rosea TaxID=64517 RepID=A0AAD5S7Q6_9FUNG|nr:hypothetical protein HK097_010370 [Rhizophlyctis rosea]
MSASVPGSAHEDVLQFLDELDNLAPQTSSAPPASTEDVLSFLNEVEAPSGATPPPVTANLTPVPQQPPKSPASAGSNVSHASTLAPTPTAQQPSTTNAGQSLASSPARSPQPKKTPPQSKPIPPSAPTQQQQQPAEGGLWGSLWSQAAKVSAVATTSLETARAMAMETAKVVSENDKVKEIMKNVDRDHIGKIGTDLSKLGQNLVDTLAPPISPHGGGGGLYLRGNNLSLFAHSITVWFCAEAAGGENIDSLHDFLQSTVSEMWLGNAVTLCEKVIVNSVKDPVPKVASSLDEAVNLVEATIERLQKLADANVSLSPTDPPNLATPSQSVFLVVQPFTTKVSSILFDEQPHVQYFILLVADDAIHVASTLSQSVVQEREDDLMREVAPPGAGGGEGAKSVGKKLARWAENQRQRVLETALTDVCEEFAFRCRLDQ